jgi:hypothetical protein
MKTRLGIVIALVELASAAGPFFLRMQAGLPAKFGLVMVFCLPIIFGLHVVEEFIFPGGAPAWFTLYHPQHAGAYTESYFFKVNAIPLVLSVLLAFGTFDFAGSFSFYGIRAWLVFLSFLAFNALFHIRGTFETKRYSPGLLVSLSLYLPLAIIGFTYLLRTGAVDVVSAVVCFGLGSVLQPALDYLKKRNSKIEGKKLSAS